MLDELDLAIIANLRSDGRKTYADLAKELNAPEATVRKRFQRLEREHILQVTAMTRLDRSAAAHDVSIALRAAPAAIRSVAESVARLDQVRWVVIATGQADVLLAAEFRTNEELLDFLGNQLGPIPGIKSIQTRQILHHVKRTYDFLPGTDDTGDTEEDLVTNDEFIYNDKDVSRKRAQGNGLDEFDLAIMSRLRADGRKTYADIAKELNAPEVTVRKRFQRLVRDNHLKIIVMTRIDRDEAIYNVAISIRVVPSELWSVANALAKLASVRWVAIATGQADILLTANFPTSGDLLDFLVNRMGKIPGIESMEVDQVLEQVKMNFRWIQEE
jgi:DNA-binding Lrp family transcriptional regulator